MVKALTELALIPAKVINTLLAGFTQTEKTVSIRGIVVLSLTATVCYAAIQGIHLSAGFVDFYVLVLEAYFGVKLAVEGVNRLRNVVPKEFTEGK